MPAFWNPTGVADPSRAGRVARRLCGLLHALTAGIQILIRAVPLDVAEDADQLLGAAELASRLVKLQGGLVLRAIVTTPDTTAEPAERTNMRSIGEERPAAPEIEKLTRASLPAGWNDLDT
jgi:hypothetical protein